jgi:outer membrane immunogenic protein
MGRELEGTAMKKFLLSGAALLALLGGSASAADLAVKARPLPPAPVYSWTGFYIGINGGGSIGVNSMTQTATLTAPGLGTSGLLTSTNRMVPTGGLFGGQLGYNWQTANWVFGVEADWQWTSQKDSNTYCTPAANVAFFGFGANGFGYCLTNEQKLKDFGTARARAGVTTGDSLWYVTGGAAWAKVEDNHLFVGSANAAIFPPAVFGPGPFFPTAASFSSRKTGWTIGGGVEARLWAGWSAKLEYLYVDLGHIDNTFAIALNPIFFPAGGVAPVTTSTHVTDNIVRVGLNYKFGFGGVMAAY